MLDTASAPARKIKTLLTTGGLHMKFSNGCWLNSEGCEVFGAREVYYTKIKENCIELVAPTIHINGKGDTLGSINLSVQISAPRENMLQIKTMHHKGQSVKGPFFTLNTVKTTPVVATGNTTPDTSDAYFTYTDTPELLTIRSGRLSLAITKKEFSMKYYWEDRLLTKAEARDLALIKTRWTGYAYDRGDDSDTYIRGQLGLSVGEKLYGTGERFTPFIKNGQTIDMWNEDGGTSTAQSYKNIPFYISDRSYGVFVNHPEKVSFELGSEFVTKAGFSVPGSVLDFIFIGGADMKEVIAGYTDLTGKPALPAPWTFGLWLSTSFTTRYDEETVLYFIDEMHRRGIGLRTFHFDACWMKDFHWVDFVWDEKIFPDPVGMLKKIHERGVNVCVWMNPYIAEESDLFEEGCKNGYFLKRKDGSVWQWDMWQPGMAIVDFTNPNACRWFQEKLEALLDMGVDCLKTDFGERIPTEDVEWFDGSSPSKMHNYYTVLYNRCVYEILEKKRGKGEAILFSRSASAGSQKYPVHWGGDCTSNYESMAESLRGGLSLTLSGFGFWSHDIGGFENTSTADVYKRWAAFGLLSTHSRLHGSGSYRVPWVYDEEAVEVVRTFTELKARLMPYLYSMAVKTHETGIPMMRAMVLEFPEDPVCKTLDRQYMLGDSLLVAPIFNEEGIAEFYLPEGLWTDWFSGNTIEGGKYFRKKYDYMSIPLFVRENSIIVLGKETMKPDYDYLTDTEVKVFGLRDHAELTVYSANGKDKITYTAEKSSDGRIILGRQ